MVEHETERGRIARALHDDIGQALLALNLGLYRLSRGCGDDPQLLEIITGLRGLLGGASRAVRRLAAEFRPVSVHACDLQTLLMSLIDQFHAESGLSCVAAVTPDALRLTREYAIVLYRILLLALNGIARRRLAARPGIHVCREGPLLSVVIRDEATAVRESPPSEKALADMPELHEWIAALEGDIQTCGGKGQDAIVCIELPLPE